MKIRLNATLREKTLLVLIYAGLFAVIIPMVIALANYGNDPRTQAGSENDYGMYEIAQKQAANGNLNEALATYSKMIGNDITDEKAWHEKGKLLIRLGYCNDAMNHYSNYLYRFTDSIRADEGFQLAKQC